MEFRTKHGALSELKMWSYSLAPITLFVYLWTGERHLNPWTFVAGGLLLVAGFAYIYIRKNTRYVFTGEKLVIKTGLFQRKIEYRQIKAIQLSRWRNRGRSPSGPITITFGKNEHFTLYPHDPSECMKLLRKRCPNVVTS